MKQRADKRYQKKKWVNGKQVFGYGRTPDEAMADLMRKIKPEAQQSPAGGYTLEVLAPCVWEPSLASLAPLTVRRYKLAADNWIYPAAGHWDVRDVRPSDVQSLVAHWVGKGHAGSTIHNTVSVLRGMFDSFIRDGIVSANPCTTLKMPRKGGKRDRVMSFEQAATLLAAVEGTLLSAPVYLALMLGPRRGEVCGLKWSDLDRIHGTLLIQRQVIALKGGRGTTETPTKGRKHRVLHLSAAMVNEIDRRGNLDSEYICTMPRGGRMDPEQLTQRWIAIRGELGFADWTFHDLRHGAAGLMNASGSSLVDIAATLGHGKPDMSWLYTSASETASKGVTTRLSNMFELDKEKP